MEARVCKSRNNEGWKEVYMAALFEDDNTKIPQRIAEAEKALATRARELFGADDSQYPEQQAIENAKYFLRILGSTAGISRPSADVLTNRGVHQAMA
jgi:hypothetical protein